MSKEQLKGGKADDMSVGDIAKLHGVSPKAIEKEIEIGMDVESEHTPSKAKQREISKDHTIEDPEYYTDPKTGLLAKEKEAEKRMEKMNEEAEKMMALAGIKEGDKKFLKNESFAENNIEDKTQPEPDSNFIVIEFEQKTVEPGPDDEKLYKLG